MSSADIALSMFAEWLLDYLVSWSERQYCHREFMVWWETLSSLKATSKNGYGMEWKDRVGNAISRSDKGSFHSKAFFASYSWCDSIARKRMASRILGPYDASCCRGLLSIEFLSSRSTRFWQMVSLNEHPSGQRETPHSWDRLNVLAWDFSRGRPVASAVLYTLWLECLEKVRTVTEFDRRVFHK